MDALKQRTRAILLSICVMGAVIAITGNAYTVYNDHRLRETRRVYAHWKMKEPREDGVVLQRAWPQPLLTPYHRVRHVGKPLLPSLRRGRV